MESPIFKYFILLYNNIVVLIKRNITEKEVGEELANLISLRNRLADRYRHVEVEKIIENTEKLPNKNPPSVSQIATYHN